MTSVEKPKLYYGSIFLLTRCSKVTGIHTEMYLHTNHNHRKQSITCSNIDYWFTCTEDWKRHMLRWEPKRQERSCKWVKSASYLLRHDVSTAHVCWLFMEEVRSAAHHCWEDVESGESEQVPDFRRSTDVKYSATRTR